MYQKKNSNKNKKIKIKIKKFKKKMIMAITVFDEVVAYQASKFKECPCLLVVIKN